MKKTISEAAALRLLNNSPLFWHHGTKLWASRGLHKPRRGGVPRRGTADDGYD